MIRNFSDQDIIINEKVPSIFLAGPTKRNSPFEKSWRKEACDFLESIGFRGIVYIPEFSNGNNPMEFLNQAEWEREGLSHASIILFYIPRNLEDLPGFTTNVEFGMWLAKRKEHIVFCSPPTAVKNRYLEWLYLKEKPNSKIFKDLNKSLEFSVNLLGR